MLISNHEILIRLLTATAIGCIIGFERKKHQKPVGMRTHVLICVAACMLAIISAYGFSDTINGVNVRADPARLVVGMLTGIGFIGAGIIWKSPSGSVQGITTAAEIFMLAAMGIAAGLGHFFLAGMVTIITMITLMANKLAEKYRQKKLEKVLIKQECEELLNETMNETDMS